MSLTSLSLFSSTFYMCIGDLKFPVHTSCDIIISCLYTHALDTDLRWAHEARRETLLSGGGHQYLNPLIINVRTG